MKKTAIPKAAQQAKKPPPQQTKISQPIRKTPVPARALTTDWVELNKDVMILSGPYSQAHKKYKSHNEQGAAICVISCVYPSLKPMNTWTKKDLESILELGTNLHVRTRLIPENKCLLTIEPNKVYKYFFLHDNKISIKIKPEVMKTKIPTVSTILDQIECFINSFFEKNPSGVFACGQTYFALWKFENYYFLFDPRDHNPEGGKWMGLPGLGYCYTLRTSRVKTLADTILKNIPLRKVNAFTFYPVELGNVVKVNTVPPPTIEEALAQPVPTLEQPKVPPMRKPMILTAPKSKPKEEPPKPTEAPPKPEEVPPPTEGAAAVKTPSAQMVSRVPSRLPPERPRLQSVTNFTDLQPGRSGILRATTHQADPKFSRYKGTQGFANAIAAISMLREHKAKTWVRPILDDVLRLGEVIHHETKHLPTGEVTPKVTIKEKNYHPTVKRYGAVGRLQTETDKILDLETALTDFLIDNDCCIVYGPIIVAVWREERRFYMFDPNERDGSGKVPPKDQPGVACVTWFTNLYDLVSLYMQNVPKANQKDRFVLHKVVVKDYEQKAEDWHNFKALCSNRWILRANFSQQDRRFPPESRNVQCTANAAMALAYKDLKPEEQWDSALVDKALIDGDQYYRDCVEHLKEAGKFVDRMLMVYELKRDFDLENKKVNLEIDDCLVNGILNAKSETGIPNIKKGFEEFFTNNDAGIVTANHLSMAVWKRDETYFYYDSHSRNEKGIVCGHGTACVLRLVTIDDLAKYFLTNLGANGENLYNISRIVVHLMDVTEDGVVRPPLNNYEAISDLISILRSNFSEKDKKWGINSGKQTIPMCMMALAMNTLISSFDWTKEDLDQVLILGDKLYAESMADNYGEEVPEELNVDDISTDNVKKQLKIGPNSFDVQFELVSQGNLEENLAEAINTYYEASQQVDGDNIFQAILESQYMTASVWRDDNLVYLFDPRPRDEKGQVYGKDDWSVKIVPPEETAEEEEDKEEAEEEAEVPEESTEESDEDDENEEGNTDEMAGGDHFAVRESEVEEQRQDIQYDADEEDNGEKGGEDEGGEEEPQPVEVKEKKGSDYWRAQEESGKACVMRFSRVEDLVQHLLDNSPPNHRQEIEFTLKTVKIENTPQLHVIHDPEQEKEDEIVGDWNEFKEVDYGRWILRGTRSLTDSYFPECNRNRQQIPMCMVALSFVFLYDLSKYKTSTVDDILCYGDRYYTLLRRLRQKELKSKKELGLTDEEIELILRDTQFRVIDYPKKMCMGEKLAFWDFKQEVACGDITSKIPEVLNLLAGLLKFFEENIYGLLQCRDYAVAVWKTDDEVYYMYDPHSTGPSGKSSPLGVACITRYKNLEDLVNTFQNNLPTYGDNFFEIHAFNFVKSDCPRVRQPAEEEQKEPKLGGFTQVTAGKQILRSTQKLDCTKFSGGVHLHSAPIAFAALAISLTTEADTWTRILVNEVLAVGEELYHRTLEKLADKFNPWEDRLDIYRVNTDFNVGRLKANCALRFKEQRGIVDVKNAKVPNLRQGLERFFEENDHGVLIIDKLVLPVWEESLSGKEPNIYIFDPNSRGVTGLPTQGGVACLMKFCNAKVAAEHVMACMVGADKSKAAFAIVPVEIVLDDGKTKKKSKVTAQKLLQSTATAKSITCQEASLIEKRILREVAEEKRRHEELKRMALLGRKEMYQVAAGQYIIRGLRAIEKDRDLPVNIVAFVFMKVAIDLNKWNYKQIDLILSSGYQLHTDSYNAYKPGTEKLSLTHVLRRVLVKGYEVRIDIKKPVICGGFTRENVLKALDTLFTKLNFTMLTYSDLLVSIYLKSGYYYLFDPYSRDLNGDKIEHGTAMLMRFDKLEELVDKVVRNLSDPEEEQRFVHNPFALIVLTVQSTQPLTSKGGVSQSVLP